MSDVLELGWNEAQLRFLREEKDSGVLLGIPGGGKTRSILGRILYRTQVGVLPPADGFLVLTFSRAACHDFRRKGEQMRPGVFTDDNVRTMHSLAGFLMSTAGAGSCSMDTVISRASCQLEREEAVGVRGEGAIGRVLRSVPWLAGVREVYVDEAQDISAVQYEFVRGLARALGAGVVLVGDPNQSIYGFQGGHPRFLMGHGGFRVQLVVNYRSTQRLVAVANASRPNRDLAEMVAAPGAARGARPILVCEGLWVLRERLVEFVRASLAAGRTVAVLGPVKNSYYARDAVNMARIGLQWAGAVLRKARVPVSHHYLEGTRDEDGSRKRDAKAFSPRRAHLFTIHGSKGLEFDDVVFLNYHQHLMGRVVTAEEHAEHRCLVFVGLSRAQRSMRVFALAGAPVWEGFSALTGGGGGGALVRTEGLSPKVAEELLSDDESPNGPRTWSWVRLLRNRRVLDERRLMKLEDLFDVAGRVSFGVTMGRAAPKASKRLPEEDELGTLYGRWAENTFYHRYRGEAPPCLEQIEAMVENLVVVPPKLTGAAHRFLAQHGYHSTSLVPVGLFRGAEEGAAEEGATSALRDLVMAEAEKRGMTVVFLYPRNICRWLNTDVLRGLTARCRDSGRRIATLDMWKMCLFLWQYEAEAGYRWSRSYERHVAALASYEDHIASVASSLPDGYLFEQPVCIEKEPPIIGMVDAIHYGRRELLELKFAPSFQMIHGVQALGYTLMLGKEENPAAWSVRVLNLRTGKTAHLPGLGKDTATQVERFLEKILAAAQ